MRSYKIVKPKKVIPLLASEVPLAAKFNQVGKISWDGTAKKIGILETGDIARRRSLKSRIKRELRKNQEGYCYYCGIHFSVLRNEDVNSHIDHFYPKGAPHRFYERFVFDTRNLVLACSICNGFGMKGDNDYGVNYLASIENIDSTIIHPYYDDITHHFKIDEDGMIEFIFNDKAKAITMEGIFKLNKTPVIRARFGDILVEKNEIDKEQKKLAEEAKKTASIVGRVATSF